MTHYLTQENFKKAGITLAAIIGCLAVIYVVKDFYAETTARHEQAGYDQALVDLVAASESTSEVNITVGEKTVRFVVVKPVEPKEGE